MSVYNNSENHGLRFLGEAECEPEYDFDKFAVWERIADGRILMATDSGCSCPSPFENTGVADLIELGSYDEFDRALIDWMGQQRRPILGEAELRTVVYQAFNTPRAQRESEYALALWRVKHIGV